MASAASCAEMLRVAPFRSLMMPKRRSAAFLRYAVGQHITTDGGSAIESPWLAMVEAVRSGVGSALGIDVRARGSFDGRFHTALYCGLWDYQETRIHQLAAAAKRSFTGSKAVVAADAAAKHHALRLALYSGSERAVRAYLLQHRPGDSLLSSVERVARRLREAGVAAVRCMPVRGRGGALPHAALPALPI
jgi:hypothetical protein